MPYLNFYTADKGTYWCRVPLVADRSDAISPYTECPTLAVRLNDTTYYAYVQKNNGSNAVAAFRHGGETYWLINRKGGMDEGVWRVFTPEDLIEFREWAEEYSSYHTSVAIMNDIDMSGYEWTPFGTADNPYTGTFSGNGYTISGLKINEPWGNENVAEDMYVGFFGVLGSDAVIDSLNLEAEVTLTDTSGTSSENAKGIGGLAGGNEGTIRGCSVTVAIMAKAISEEGIGSIISYIGGITGINVSGGSITGCESSGTITVEYELADTLIMLYTGGVVGINSGTVSDCVNRCDIQVSSSNTTMMNYLLTGGVIGRSESTGVVDGITNYGNVSATCNTQAAIWANYVGAIMGYNSGSYSNIANYGTPADTEIGFGT